MQRRDFLRHATLGTAAATMAGCRPASDDGRGADLVREIYAEDLGRE